MPGLIEAHSHVLLHPYNETPWNDQVAHEALAVRIARATMSLKATLDAGFTTVRNVGADNYDVRGLLDDVHVKLFGMYYPAVRLMVAAIALTVLATLSAFLKFSRHGLWMRAVKYNPSMASALGVPTGRIFAYTFGIGVGFAALSGALAAPMVSVSTGMGLDILVPVFIVVIVGGLGNLPGCAVVAILMATIEGVATIWVSPTMARIVTFLMLGVIVLVRPNGMFAPKSVREV